MALDLVTAALETVSGALGLAKPLVDDHISQKYENEAKQRSREWLAINSNPEGQSRADKCYAYLLLLCADAGTPVRGTGTNRSVPDDVIDALIDIAIDYIKTKELLANLQFKR